MDAPSPAPGLGFRLEIVDRDVSCHGSFEGSGA